MQILADFWISRLVVVKRLRLIRIAFREFVVRLNRGKLEKFFGELDFFLRVFVAIVFLQNFALGGNGVLFVAKFILPLFLRGDSDKFVFYKKLLCLRPPFFHFGNTEKADENYFNFRRRHLVIFGDREDLFDKFHAVFIAFAFNETVYVRLLAFAITDEDMFLRQDFEFIDAECWRHCVPNFICFFEIDYQSVGCCVVALYFSQSPRPVHAARAFCHRFKFSAKTSQFGIVFDKCIDLFGIHSMYISDWGLEHF